MNRIPTFVIVGNAGSGKSTLSNTLSSSQQFKESQSIYAETKETIGYQGNFNGQSTFVIDSPWITRRIWFRYPPFSSNGSIY